MTRWRLPAVLALLAALHLAQCVRCFGSWAAVSDDQPLVGVDHALHLYFGWLGKRSLATGGSPHGYDPHFLAGYPKSPLHDPSSLLAEVGQLLAPGSPDWAGASPAAYKWTVLLVAFAAPLMAAAAAARLGLPPVGVAAAALLAGLYFWTGYPQPLFHSGLVAFLLASALLAPTLAAADGGSLTAGRALALAAAGGGLLAFHPTGVVMAAPGLLLLALRQPPPLGWRPRLLAAAVAACLAAAVLLWAWPLAEVWGYRRQGFAFQTAPPDDWTFALGYYRRALEDEPVAAALLALGLAGLLLPGTAAGRVRRALGPTLAWLATLTFLGSLSALGPLRGLEPLRFQVPWHLTLAVPAGLAVARAPRWLAVSALVAAALLWREPWTAAGERLAKPRPLPRGLKPAMSELVDWLRANTDRSGRVLLEDQLRLLEATEAESLHWTPLLPLLVDREFVGGQYHETPLRHMAASLGDFTLGSRPIEGVSPAELEAFLDRYAIRWAVAWSDRSRLALRQAPSLRSVGLLPRHTSRPREATWELFARSGNFSWASVGAARIVDRGVNRLELADLVPAGGLVALKYHYDARLRIDPPVPGAELLPLAAPGDPVPMLGLRLNGPTPRLTIRGR